MCSWNIACRRCSNYIFILDLTPDFNGLGKDNCKMRRKTLKFWDLVCLILDVWWHFVGYTVYNLCNYDCISNITNMSGILVLQKDISPHHTLEMR